MSENVEPAGDEAARLARATEIAPEVQIAAIQAYAAIVGTLLVTELAWQRERARRYHNPINTAARAVRRFWAGIA